MVVRWIQVMVSIRSAAVFLALSGGACSTEHAIVATLDERGGTSSGGATQLGGTDSAGSVASGGTQGGGGAGAGAGSGGGSGGTSNAGTSEVSSGGSDSSSSGGSDASGGATDGGGPVVMIIGGANSGVMTGNPAPSQEVCACIGAARQVCGSDGVTYEVNCSDISCLPPLIDCLGPCPCGPGSPKPTDTWDISRCSQPVCSDGTSCITFVGEPGEVHTTCSGL